MTRPAAGRPPMWRFALTGLAIVVVVLGVVTWFGQTRPGAAAEVSLTHTPKARTPGAAPAVATSGPRRTITLGTGLLSYPDEATRWVAAHPTDTRAARIGKRIAGKPTALWLTGDESFTNLSSAVSMARSADKTMTLSIYNIPLRYDGLTAPSTVTLSQYKAWISHVAKVIGSTRAIIVLEPDALWFYDRMPTDASRQTRLTALRYALSTLHARAPNAAVYLDAGTSSGSVTPQRMAALLDLVGMQDAAGFAVDVSSYAPEPAIQAYAQSIRAALQSAGLADPRYVVDTSRNGASTWSTTWCNPTEQRLGLTPRVIGGADGRDLDLWIKAPGTSDGDCGPPGAGQGTAGGEFMPAVAYKMITG